MPTMPPDVAPSVVREGAREVFAALGLDADAEFVVRDLISGARFTWRGERNYVRLDPAAEVAHVLVLER
jgi:starch synthase (maltosyl-transferring)